MDINLAFILLFSYGLDFLVNVILATGVLVSIIRNHFASKVWRPLFTFLFLDLLGQAIIFAWLMVIRFERIYSGDIAADKLFSSPIWIGGNLINSIFSLLFLVTTVVLLYLNEKGVSNSKDKKEG